jgi:undecaprenyl-diphosphatase
MEYLQSILLGVIQGITEFLPISSSGHLVLGEELFRSYSSGSSLNLGAAEANLVLNIALHIGTLGSIVVIYFRQLCATMRDLKLLAAVIVATIPAGVIGLLFKDHLETFFGSTLAVGAALCLTAAILSASRHVDRGTTELQHITLRQALLIGICQAVALIPGVSRSGSTIVGGLWAGLERGAAATFSFLIAIPAIGGAAVLMIKDLVDRETAAQTPWAAYLAGTVVAFAVGLLALKWLLRIISQRKLHHFAWYCLSVGLITIALSIATSANS